MAQLTDKQRDAQRRADELGREYVTTIDGRVAIILRPRSSDEATAETLARIVSALEAAGIA